MGTKNPLWLDRNGGVFIALVCVLPGSLLRDGDSIVRMEIFTGMLVHDGFSILMRSLLLAFLLLFFVFLRLSGIPDRDDYPDVVVLLMGATLGFCLMITANHLLMVFMAIEMASVPSYVLAGMMKRNRLGSEAALKYAVYGAGAAGIMVYGISLLSGLVNAVHLPTIAVRLAERLPAMESPEFMVLALALLMIGVGLAFKLSAVPFHFWCPDVFEGAPAEIGAFLSVASKAAALVLLLRIVLGVGWIGPDGVAPGERTAQLANTTTVGHLTTSAGLFSVQEDVPVSATEPQPATTASANASLDLVRSFLAQLIALLAVITCTFGNLAAYGQTNIKRLLAYSTIAHAGYMLMAIPAVLELANRSSAGAQYATAALILYVIVYLFLNLGAFSIVGFLRDRRGSEQIADYAGLLKTSPGIAICLTIILFGLIGLPPLSGFLGKFVVFAALTDAFRATGYNYLIILFLVAGVNTAISLFYYLRIVRTMITPSTEQLNAADALPIGSPQGLYVLLLTLPTVFLILGWEQVTRCCLDCNSLTFWLKARL